MNKYERNPDLIVDLHGRTIRESTEILDALIVQPQIAHARIIVGKGLHSQKGPVLRDFVKEYFYAKDIRCMQSKITDGGEGALEVYL